MRAVYSAFKKSLGRRLLVYFTLLTMIPLVAAGFMIYRISDTRMSSSALRLSSQIMSNVSMDLEQLLSDADNLSQLIAADTMLQQGIQQRKDLAHDTHETQIAMNQRMKQLGNYYDSIHGVYLVFDDGSIAKSRYYTEKEQNGLTKEQYELGRNRAGVQWYVSLSGSVVADNMGNGVLYRISSLTDHDTGQPCGVIVIEIKLSDIQKIMNADLGENSNFYLSDSKGNILVERTENEENHLLVTELVRSEVMNYELGVYDKDRFFVLCQRIPVGGWTVSGLVYKDFLRQDSKKIMEALLLIAAFAFFINVCVSRYLKNYELKPIEDMMRYVKQIEKGEFKADIEPVRDDEVGKLASSMKRMTMHIGQLLETVRRNEAQLRWAEFKMLQAQINPHFLYNTLDSIKWLIKEGETEKANEMVSALTEFFRKVLSQGKDLVTIAHETEHVESYLKIQKIRYHKKFDYFIYVEEVLREFLIPKLLLQPIVENALYHGMKPSARKCILRINIIADGEDVIMEVRDDGVGMTQEKQREIIRSMNQLGANRTETYGMGNVNDRIRILAGDRYGIKIRSDLGLGTSVSIRLPKKLERGVQDVPRDDSR